jgi:hypothetical protein
MTRALCCYCYATQSTGAVAASSTEHTVQTEENGSVLDP